MLDYEFLKCTIHWSFKKYQNPRNKSMQDLNRENFKALLKYILKDYGNYDICNIMGQEHSTIYSSLHTDVCSKNIPMETPIVSFLYV